MKKIVLLSGCFLLMLTAACAEKFNTVPALKGISRVKVICDVNVPDPETLLTRMLLIEKTYNQLAEAGIDSTFVVAFRGGASRYVTQGDAYVDPLDLDYKQKMKDWLERFSERGFILEQCAIAAGFQNIDTRDFLPQLKVVENSYISIIGYQSQGFALLPMD